MIFLLFLLQQNVLAKALFDNVAESPDELSFRKGDIMTVLERDTQGLDGWWLCSLHGRQGIVPGNRLKILVGMYDNRQQPATSSTPDPAASCPASLPPQSIYTKPTINTSSLAFANKAPSSAPYTSMHQAYSIPGPAQPNPDSIYMMPPSHGPKPSPQSMYQVPAGSSGPPSQPVPPSKAPALSQRQYQLPSQDIYQVPPSIGPGQVQGQSSAVGVGAGQDVYQVPPSLDKRGNKPLGKVRKNMVEKSLWMLLYHTHRHTHTHFLLLSSLVCMCLLKAVLCVLGQLVMCSQPLLISYCMRHNEHVQLQNGAQQEAFDELK